MTDVVNGISQGTDVQPSEPIQQNNVPEERSFRQSEVSDIVKNAKRDAVETYRRMQAQQPQYVEQKYGDNTVNTPNNVGNDFRKIVSEEIQRSREEWEKNAIDRMNYDNAQKTLNNFYSKVSQGREKYQDFDTVTGDIQLDKFPNVVQLLGDHAENSADILYELGKDMIKMSNLEDLAIKSPKGAIAAVSRLSQSIKDNEAAKNLKIPNQPLSQLRPSNTGTDSGPMSVSDYRKKYRGLSV